MSKFAAVMASVLILVAATAAVAQYVDESHPSNYGFRALVYRPTSKNLRKVKSSWFGAGVDIYTKRDEDNKPTAYATIEYLTGSNNFVDTSMVPLTYTVVFRKKLTENKSSYFGVGAGAYWLKVKNPIASHTGFRPGVNVAYGMEFGETFFAELRGDALPSFEGVGWSGISLNVGTRVGF